MKIKDDDEKICWFNDRRLNKNVELSGYKGCMDVIECYEDMKGSVVILLIYRYKTEHLQ